MLTSVRLGGHQVHGLGAYRKSDLGANVDPVAPRHMRRDGQMEGFPVISADDDDQLGRLAEAHGFANDSRKRVLALALRRPVAAMHDDAVGRNAPGYPCARSEGIAETGLDGPPLPFDERYPPIRVVPRRATRENVAEIDQPGDQGDAV